jgi:uncharacterized protein
MQTMRRDAGKLILSASDLSNFLNCRHRSALEMGEAFGKRRRPAWTDPLLEALFARGLEHERSYVSTLGAAGKRIIDLSEVKAREEALDSTLEAMRTGAEVIVQGTVGDGRWYGRPDILLRVNLPSALGSVARDFQGPRTCFAGTWRLVWAAGDLRAILRTPATA